MRLVEHTPNMTSLRSILFSDAAEFRDAISFAYTCPLDPVARCHERKPRKLWHLSTLLSNTFLSHRFSWCLEGTFKEAIASILYTFDRVPMMSAAWAVLVLAAGAEAFGPQPAGLLHHAGASVRALSSRPSLRVGRAVGLKVCARPRVSRRRALRPRARRNRARGCRLSKNLAWGGCWLRTDVGSPDGDKERRGEDGRCYRGAREGEHDDQGEDARGAYKTILPATGGWAC